MMMMMIIIQLWRQDRLAQENNMRETVDLNSFRRAFKAYGRENQFSYEGLTVLFNYLEGLEDDRGVEIELNVMDLCWEYTEDSIQNIADNYELTGDREAIIAELRDNTQVIEIDDDNIIIQDY